MRATAKDLRLHVRELLEAVERGEEVLITYRGKPRARLVPLKRTAEERRHASGGPTPLFGIWRDHADTEDVAAYVERLRESRG